MSLEYSVTRDDVVWAYRTILGRDPEDENCIIHVLDSRLDLRELISSLLLSTEFRAKSVADASSLINSMHVMENIEVDVGDSDMERLLAHIRKVWSSHGQEEPYWSVLTDEKYRKSKISDSDVREFYASGAPLVDLFEANCRKNGIAPLCNWTILDFGCGMGRVGEHFAQRYKSYIGVDISADHLRLAESCFMQLRRSGVHLGECRFLLLPDYLADNRIQYDVFFSFIVLQHNPPPLIQYLLSHCLSRVRKGGLAFFQLPNYIHGYEFSVADYLSGKERHGPMEMHPLPQPYVFKLLARYAFEVLMALPHESIGPAGLSLVYLARRAG